MRKEMKQMISLGVSISLVFISLGLIAWVEHQEKRGR